MFLIVELVAFDICKGDTCLYIRTISGLDTMPMYNAWAGFDKESLYNTHISARQFSLEGP